MIREITLTNFQGFKGEQTVRLAPITLIFGPNSAGKSSIGRALRLLKQSNDSTFDFVGPEVNLGHIENAIYGQGSENDVSELSVALKLDPLKGDVPQNFQIICKLSQNFNPDQEGTYQPTFATTGIVYKNQSDRQAFILVESEVEGPADSLTITDPGSVEDLIWSSSTEKLRTVDQILEQASQTSDDKTLLEILNTACTFEVQGPGIVAMAQIHESELPDDDVVSPTRRRAKHLEVFWDKLVRSVFVHLKSVRHLIPLRETPSRVVLNEKLKSPLDASAFDLNLTNYWLGRLTGGRYKFVSTRHLLQEDLGEPLQLTSNYVVDLYTGALVGFDDLGTGIGQVLPVLQALCPPTYSKASGAILIVEQPELHLHPAMQAGVFDAIQDAIGGHRIQQILIETHSEAMLLRLQRAIRRGEIKPEDATLVFVEPSPITEGEPGARRHNLMYNIEFLPTGELESALPLSFAGLRLSDLVD